MAANDAEKKALTRAVSLINSSYKKEEQFFVERQFYKDMYHSYDDALLKKQAWQTKFAHPFPFFLIETQSSFLLEGVFGVNNPGLWTVTPVDPTNPLIVDQAKMSEKLFNFQEQNSNLREEFYLGTKEMGITGDWFMEVLWDRDEVVIQQPSSGHRS